MYIHMVEIHRNDRNIRTASAPTIRIDCRILSPTVAPEVCSGVGVGDAEKDGVENYGACKRWLWRPWIHSKRTMPKEPSYRTSPQYPFRYSVERTAHKMTHQTEQV